MEQIEFPYFSPLINNMKKGILLFLLAPIFAFGQDTLNVSTEQRGFCLNVVKSIIEHNCDEYFNSISDSVVYYGGARDTILSKSRIKQDLLMMCYASVKNDSLDYKYYFENFSIKFYDVRDIAAEIGRGNGSEESTLGTLNYYNIQEGDVFFQGAYHKTRNRLDFILDDTFKFVFRKVKGEYKIIVITP
jgi:hypothetical protein